MSTRYKNIIILTLLCWGLFLVPKHMLAQGNQIDSLKKCLSTASEIQQVDLLNQLVNKLRNSNPDEARKFHAQLFTIATKIKSNSGLGDYYNNEAKFFYFEGNYDQAIINYDKCLTYRKPLKDTLGIGNVLGNMGVTYRKKGDYAKALDFYLQALEVKNTLKDKSDAIGVINNIGGLYYYQRNYDKANTYYTRALEMATKAGDSSLIATANGNLALVYDDKGESNKALNYALRSFKIKEKIGSVQEIAIAYNNIGRIYEHLDKVLLALDYYQKANGLYTELEDVPSKSNTLFNIGDLYLRKKDNKNALVYLDSSYQLCLSINNRTQLRDVYYSLAHTYHNLGKNDLAFTFLNKHAALNDSIFDEESLGQQSEMEAKYQTQIREGQIEKLKIESEIKSLKEIESKRELKSVLIYGIIALLFLMGIVWFLLSRIRLKRKAHEDLVKYNSEIVSQKSIIEIQKAEIEEKQKEMVDSINYANRIQKAVIANVDLIKKYLPNHFIYFQPKDIVSGDFYWAAEHHNMFYLAVGDSTGHGVPGAFMSLLNVGFLSEVIKEMNVSEPAQILNQVRQRLIDTIGAEGQQDGMDVILIAFEIPHGNEEITEIYYAAANNEPILIRDCKLNELPKDRMPVGIGEKNESFTSQTLKLQKGDILYLYTDGFADQFGGARGKKYKFKRLNELLFNVHQQSFDKQKEMVSQEFVTWKGNLEQVDDVCIVGLKF